MTVTTVMPAPYEGSRACFPDREGYVERDGVRVHWEAYGSGAPTVLFMPTWSIAHSRVWRNQIAYFARHCRVVVFDGRGCGRSDRPADPSAYLPHEFVADAVDVLDATATQRTIAVSLSMGTAWNLLLAAVHPSRVDGCVFVGPTLYAVREPYPPWSLQPFEQRLDSYDGFEGQNRWFIAEHYEQFAAYWNRMVFPERHSTRALEFGRGMALETTPEVLLATLSAAGQDDRETTAERLAAAGQMLQPVASQVRCPALVIQGALDPIAPTHFAEALAEDTGAELVLIDDAGHHPGGRKPVRFNLELRRFVERVAAQG
jgi:pimeloyl-ACP methyl ester carboxylesterase